MSRRRGTGCAGVALGMLALVVLMTNGCEEAAQEPPSPPPATPKAAPKGKAAKSARTKKAPTPTPTRSGESKERWVDIERARAVLPTLPVKGRAPLTDYSREAFGSAWSDVNDNGCDTRNDILRRDLRDIVVVDCVVTSGELVDPYSGQTVAFTRGPVTSLDVQIDHVVALANAWQTGADRWPAAKRERFANDRRNLLAVRGDLNLQKSDADAATWLPPRRAYRCTYVAMQIQTKQRYGLWVTAPEKAAMERVLSDC